MADDTDQNGRAEFTHDPVDGIDVWGGMTVGELVAEYGQAGLGAGALHEAADILTEMVRRDDVTTFVGVAGAMVPAGMRQLLTALIRGGHVDAFVTTGATLTHDTIEAIGGAHHAGRERHPEKSRREHDETLRDEGVDRIYDIYLPQDHFVEFETHLRENVFPELDDRVSIREFIRVLGEANLFVNEREDIDRDAGIAAAASRAEVPIFCPAIQDSVLGLQAWMHSQVTPFELDALADMTDLTDIAHAAEQTGALVVGGGVPKNFVLQTMLVVPGAYDYAVQLTADPEYTGGLSGATLDEARSWGKLEKSARNATVVGDATITLPLVVAAALDATAD